ncbi:glutathione S-transferase C-terminal domain-containing protein [Streptomyces sp. NPDC006173]|uniref:glutathione S-transferase C-terminal domain-containing protein n=1 Tax=Streptomyces sp. NPDC006173 TaxID=3155349 RepID=UPI0033DF2936
MPETASRGSSTAGSLPCGQSSPTHTADEESLFTRTGGQSPFPSATRSRTSTPPLLPRTAHSRIGVGLAGGFYPAPHRYEVYLAASCPRSLRISITLGLLGLTNSVATTLLTHPAGTPDAFASLRRAYEATEHHYGGPFTAPALCDRWTGRIVSNDTSDILRDLTGLPSGHAAGRAPSLLPPSLATDIEALRDLLDRDVTPSAHPSDRTAALDLLDCQLSSAAYMLGDSLTAADVDVWVALSRLAPAGTLCAHPRLRDYVRRLGELPAFRTGNDGVRAAA